MKQPQYQPYDLDKMVMSLWATSNNKLTNVPVEYVNVWERDMHAYMDANHPEIGQTILRTKDLPKDTIDSLDVAMDDFNSNWSAPE